ncbi:MAG: hypothetical protein JW768_02510 [Chitinispirillaceae bacterium]|nr:hypothetical protein [Chitinispirillaceae bacterium]
MNLRIGDLIEAPPVQTVIRLEEGASRSKTITGTFVATEEVTGHLTILAGALKRGEGRGFFLEGDFGSGKSHFLAALSAWAARREGAETLEQAVPALAGCFEKNRPLLPVDISLVRFRAATPLERIVTNAVEAALAAKGQAVALSPLGRFQAHLQTLLGVAETAAAFEAACGVAPEGVAAWFGRQPHDAYTAVVAFMKQQGIELPEALVEERHATFDRTLAAVRNAGFAGLLIIIDELSEFFRSKNDTAALNEDARTLQLLGELTATHPLWIIAAVQESIERTGDIASATFRKIKDRFPVRFHLSTLHIRDLIAKRLVRHKKGASENLLALYNAYKRHFPEFTFQFEQFAKIYPVHPETLRLLEGLGNLFSQHRGIVDFVHARVAGDEGRGIPGILDRDAGELLAPDAIYEHFCQRLSEFTAYHVFPRTIVPHLDETIDAVIAEKEDRPIAKKLVRMLVLYAIHPTARKPTVRELAALCSCMLADHDPDANAQFVAGVLLDPLAVKSRFLVKRVPPSGDRLDAVYELTVQEDLAGTVRRRIENAMNDIRPNDSRPLLEPLAELPASMSWPGPETMRDGVERTVMWRQTSRRAIVLFVADGDEEAAGRRIDKAISSGCADFAVAIITGANVFSRSFTAVWRMGDRARDGGVLAEFFAARSVARELQPANPSHAPLIGLVQDHLRRLEPAAAAALMECLYAGSFIDPGIFVDPSALQVRRFDRLLEAAASSILEERYPRFKEIAPRLLQPSSRLYQRIVDEFVVPGSLSMSEARAASLTEAIETLAAPLGLVEVKAGSYRFAPAIGEHPLLTCAFSLLRTVGQTPRDEVRTALMTGPWGLPAETVEFLLVSLACSGALMLLRSGRPVALDLLSIAAVDSADAIAPGEIVSAADRETLMRECPFLAPQGGWPSFGLRQQREAWQALVKMKASSETMLDGIQNALRSMEEFEAFSSFDFDAIGNKVKRFASVLAEVKVSYPAREGIERFCAAWRASGLSASDLDQLKQVHRFFSRFADKFIFIVHYLRHRSVENACLMEEGVASRREALGIMLKDPLRLVIPDEGLQLGAAFDLFREEYAHAYAVRHRAFYKAQRPRKLARAQERMLDLFGRLNRVEQLDRPQGLDALLRLADRNVSPVCERPVIEELLRSPACGCGFVVGSEPPPAAIPDHDAAFERTVSDYRAILAAPAVVEAITAHAFALRDMDTPLAGRLEKLCAILREKSGALAAPLLDLLDEKTVAEIGRALSGSVKVKNKGLLNLVNELSGRRLTPSKVRAVFNEWLKETDESTLLSMDAPAAPASAAGAVRPVWWPLLHPELEFPMPHGSQITPDEAADWEARLEAHFPGTALEKLFKRMEPGDLVRFMTGEPLHTRAVQAAWNRLFDKCVNGGAPLTDGPVRSRHGVPRVAEGIDFRLGALRLFQEVRGLPFPQRLRGRVHAAALWADQWSTRDNRKAVESWIKDSEKQAADWYAALPAAAVVDLSTMPLVIIIDALPPDVWLEATAQCGPLLEGSSSEWGRIAAAPHTVPSLAALFGFAAGRDPLDEFAAIGVTYHTITGDEQHPLADCMPPMEPSAARVVRVNLLDAAAHGVTIPLHQFPGTLCTVLARHLPGVIALCKKQKRRLVLTADHGLSWTAGTLSHGRGGVFEEAVPRVEWKW